MLFSAGDADSLRQLTAVRDALGSAVRRYEALQLDRRRDSGSSDSDEGDFEEVPEAEDAGALVARAARPDRLSGTAGTTPAAPRAPSSSAAPEQGSTAAPEPNSSAAPEQSSSAAPEPSSSAAPEQSSAEPPGLREPAVRPDAEPADERAARRSCLLARAPRLGYSADLVTWERGPGPAAGPAPHHCETARVWRSADDTVPPPPAESAHLRVTEFSGQFEPVRHRCGARLPSGRPCPRADRLKCPLHGPIVARDEHGEPLNAELRQREREARARGDDWQVSRPGAARAGRGSGTHAASKAADWSNTVWY